MTCWTPISATRACRHPLFSAPRKLAGPRARQNLKDKMVQSLIGKHARGGCGSCLRRAVPPSDLREQSADLRIRVELGHLVRQHFVGANAPLDETPHSLFVGRAVRVRIERARERPVFVFQQFDDEEAVL